MIKTCYGDIPKIAVDNYFDVLINKTYKILPMKEEGTPTLKSYIESFARELIGAKKLMQLDNNCKALTLVSTITYLSCEEYDVATCKKEVFKCIHILNELSEDFCEV